ncbi:hypothetical protein IVB33_07045 [Bradyrhizobium sp. 24]|uniref:hypothetical protein n=1 Tax=unclassified Bradyrhizobium TaxID=2631580 RepID=UPI001FF89341|nr:MULTISPECIES: hypothetical protein [unclassified Bradyrhizobium]MCK1297318.1 hypothetical protein [Bradyrhizobium sp. 37]MCK1378014.1 hypothetical protein [Bradyrhizobium sp. 24]MCK1769324.1 hypothetical protein [Bradyrhizobium sp. 134]
MLIELKESLKGTAIWRQVLKPIRAERENAIWRSAGSPTPPPHSIKARNILCLADLYQIDTLVETGTFRGDMIAATKNRFRQIISIEVYEPLAQAAADKFSRDANVKIICGDSAEVLPDVARQLSTPAVFWLDGHYSGPSTGTSTVETPILAEIESLATLRRGMRDVILIDDARAFGTERDYPPLEDFVERLSEIFARRPIIANDAIIVLPSSEAA